jgi:hypothetical protein
MVAVTQYDLGLDLRDDANARTIVTTVESMLLSTANERVYVRGSTLRRQGSGHPLGPRP